MLKTKFSVKLMLKKSQEKNKKSQNHPAWKKMLFIPTLLYSLVTNLLRFLQFAGFFLPQFIFPQILKSKFSRQNLYNVNLVNKR